MTAARFLIAEDNYLLADEVGDFVRSCGYEVAGAAPSLERALRMIEGARVDGAILDIDLAGQASFPLCQVLQTKGVPFLFLTGYARGAMMPREFHAAPQVDKPFEAPVLRSALANLVAPFARVPHFGNAVLDGLGPRHRAALAGALTRVSLHAGALLDSPARPARHIYFPVEALLSVLTGAGTGRRIEVVGIGHDGMTSPALVLGDESALGDTVVQAGGSAWRLAVADLRHLMESEPGLRHHLTAHVATVLRQLADTTLFAGRATVVERVAHWIFQAIHRVGAPRLDLTHEALSEILGVRRASVTNALQLLESDGIIRSRRRLITVRDHGRLTALARRLKT
jgi:CRP-like cAMP-binding protein/CheY-like chemotaxis protein